MAYDPTLPTDKDRVRLLIGDTDPDDELLADTEIEFLLALGQDLYRSAAEACRAVAGKLARSYAQLKSETIQVTDRSPERYAEMAERFDAQARESIFAAPALASLTPPEPFFTRGMFGTQPMTPSGPGEGDE